MSHDRHWDQQDDEGETSESLQPSPELQRPLLPIIGKPRDLVELHNSCPACGSNLHMIHITDFIRNITQETAKCPECGIQTRKVLHHLQ